MSICINNQLHKKYECDTHVDISEELLYPVANIRIVSRAHELGFNDTLGKIRNDDQGRNLLIELRIVHLAYPLLAPLESGEFLPAASGGLGQPGQVFDELVAQVLPLRLEVIGPPRVVPLGDGLYLDAVEVEVGVVEVVEWVVALHLGDLDVETFREWYFVDKLVVIGHCKGDDLVCDNHAARVKRPAEKQTNNQVFQPSILRRDAPMQELEIFLCVICRISAFPFAR
mmetsp:Transcript_58431/g.153934  ORF Transcript_58431/g.153934 Transcript_58431/m.153934 type:complete len:228 (-) Transcript_58431:61-744(-)